jgi:hypothetical protein
VLIYDRMNGHGRVDAWQVMPALIVSQGFDNRDGTVLTICGKPPPPNNSKDLTGMEVVHALTGVSGIAQPLAVGARCFDHENRICPIERYCVCYAIDANGSGLISKGFSGLF